MLPTIGRPTTSKGGKMTEKNLCAKTVKKENAYEVWSVNGWT